jgi:superfamily II DNA helicase RecQ
MTENTELCKCSRCKCLIILETYFSKNRKGEYYKTCDSCRDKTKKYYKDYREQNKEVLAQKKKIYNNENKEVLAQKQKEYYKENKEVLAQKKKEYYKDNKEHINQKSKIYNNENQEDIAQKQKEYYKENKEVLKQKSKIYNNENQEDLRQKRQIYKTNRRHFCEHNVSKSSCRVCNPTGHLRSLVAGRIHGALKANKSKGSLEYLGCDIPTFREHLEKSFKEGMNWENQGEWHIDHIIPVLYKQDDIEPSIEEVGKRLHYTNCQAMWAAENFSKGNRYTGGYQSE